MDATLRIFIENHNYNPVAQTMPFGLISGAYACSPEPNIIYEQEIDNIVIITQDAFAFDSEEYSIVDTVNHIFRVLNFDTDSLNDFIAEQNSNPPLFGELGSDLVLQLDGPVADTIRANFNVVFIFKDESEHRVVIPEYRAH